MEGMERWRGRVALVTGASSGIGRAVATALARAGMRVAVCARRLERLEDLRRSIEAGGGEVLATRADLRDEAQILEVFRQVRERWGGVDALVNNAGLGREAPLVSGATDLWREMLEVNVLALCISTREAIRDMRARGDDGHVVHVSSMAAHRVPWESGVYSATKFAVRSLTEGLRQELRTLESGIRVSAVSPGYVETEFAEVWAGDREAARETYGRYPVLQPEDVASAVIYVLSRPAYMQVHDLLVRPTRQKS
jgi:NADP-dependent 3-hydroxy acid dehydrogenase YdfG